MDPAALAERRRRRPAGERHRPLRQAVAAALPVPVELGLGLRRDRARGGRPRARPRRGALAARGAVGRRDGAAHRLPSAAGRVQPRGGALGVARVRRRARRADERHHAAAGARHRRARPARGRPGPRLPRGGAAGDRGVARLVPSRAGGRRPRRGAASVGIGRQRAALRPGARAAGHRRGRGPAPQRPKPGRREPSGRPISSTADTSPSSMRCARAATGPGRRSTRRSPTSICHSMRSLRSPRTISRSFWARSEPTARVPKAAADRLRVALAGTLGRGSGRLPGARPARGEGITDTVADLFPLYAGVPDERQARRLVDEHLAAPDRFGAAPDAPWAITTVAKSSDAFAPRNYWRGPVWINVNWCFVRGLERCGFDAEADGAP